MGTNPCATLEQALITGLMEGNGLKHEWLLSLGIPT